MNWKIKIALLAVIAVPAFSGFPLTGIEAEVLPGLSYGPAAYLILLHTALLMLIPNEIHAIMVSIAALIALPVVFVGSAVSTAFIYSGISRLDFYVQSLHYTKLCITMLTVVPLALSFIVTIPFQNLENYLLRNPAGVSSFEKTGIMFLRVFNHVVFFVIPDILEVIREERSLGGHIASDAANRRPGGPILKRAKYTIDLMMHLAMESICASVQYIPLWAAEIAQLPDRKGGGRKEDRKSIGRRA